MDTFRDAITSKPMALSAELCLQPRTTAAEMAAAAALLAPVVDAVQIDDNRRVLGHMSATAAASIMMANGLDALAHVTCRDRNRVALQAELLGAAALGITSLVLSRGEKLADKGSLRGKGVFDLSGAGLFEMATRIGADVELVDSPGLLLGATVIAFKSDANWEAGRITEAIDAGARFLQTQPCMNLRLLRSYMKVLVALKIPHRASIVVDVPLITSRQVAETYKRDYPNALLPKACVARIVESNDEVAEGIALCADVMREVSAIPGVSGINISDASNPEHVVAAIQQADFPS